MAIITDIRQLTFNRFVNLFHLKGKNTKGFEANYFVAARSKDIEGLKITTRRNDPDGVAIYSLYGEKKDRVVLVRQYRYPIDDYVYEFPAGLCEPGENFREAAVRELYEETGLKLTPVEAPRELEEPRFTTVGMTDESVATVYGYASGTPNTEHLEKSEELEVVLADKAEIRRILKEEKVALLCAYQLMHFLADDEPFAFIREAEGEPRRDG